MNTYPLHSLSLEEAMKLQFKVVDCITKEFEGHEILTRGDLGVVMGLNKPVTTAKAEKVIARIFDAEACVLVRGAGSAAIRFGLHTMLKCGQKILVHKAPIYNTTATSIEMLGLVPVEADYNDLEEIRRVLKREPDIQGALVQYTRQKMDDRYDMEEVVRAIKETKDIPVLTDDNYAVMKVKKIGIQCGADLSCFSSFKLLGPEGIGIIVGKQQYIEQLVSESYSGGMQTQGYEALDVLHGLGYAPVSLHRFRQQRVRRSTRPSDDSPSFPIPSSFRSAPSSSAPCRFPHRSPVQARISCSMADSLSVGYRRTRISISFSETPAVSAAAFFSSGVRKPRTSWSSRSISTAVLCSLRSLCPL